MSAELRGKDARTMGATEPEADRLEGEARRLLTTWSKGESVLREYAHREWGGLLANYYHGRWELYFDDLSAQLAGGSPNPPDFPAYESAWTQQTDREGADYPAAPKGDGVAISAELFDRYAGP